VLYHRLPRLVDTLALARGDGRHARVLRTLARVELLILDDWGLSATRPAGADGGSTWPRLDRGDKPASGRALA
jgi:DNA replication protein DnaC